MLSPASVPQQESNRAHILPADEPGHLLDATCPCHPLRRRTPGGFPYMRHRSFRRAGLALIQGGS